MSTIPPNIIELPALAPLPYGLYSAAILQDVPAARGGVQIRPAAHTATVGADWLAPCSTGDGASTKTGAGDVPPGVGDTFGVYAAWECATVGTGDDEALASAVNALPAVEQVQAEKHVAALLAASDTTVAGGDAAAQIDAAEKQLAALGVPGLVHAPRWRAREFDKAGAIIRQGQALFTPGGHRWVFGSGYENLEARIAVSGRVVVQRDPVAQTVTVNHKTNQRLAVAERLLAVAVEPTITLIEGA